MKRINNTLRLVMLNILNGYFLIFIILTFTLLFYFTFFTIPQGDDFFFATAYKSYGFFGSFKYWFSNWTGRFSSIFFINLLGATVDIFEYRLYSFFLVFTLAISILLFLKRFIISENSNLVTLRLMFITALICLAIPEKVTAFYYVNNAIVYVLPISIFLFFYILFYNNKKTYFTIILGFIICGFNESYGIILIYFLITHYLNTYHTRLGVQLSGSIKYVYALNLIIIILASSILLLAPGNFVRANSENLLTIEKIFVGLVEATKYFIFNALTWIQNPFTISIICTLLLIKKNNYQNKSYLIHGLFFLGASFINILPSYIVTSGFVEPRIINVSYIFFSISIIFFFVELRKKYFGESLLDGELPKKILLLLFSILFSMPSLISSDIRDLLKDVTKAQVYSEIFDARLKEIELKLSEGSDLLIIDNVFTEKSEIPLTIFFWDVSTNSNYQVNKIYADYFGVKKVVSSKENFKSRWQVLGYED